MTWLQKWLMQLSLQSTHLIQALFKLYKHYSNQKHINSICHMFKYDNMTINMTLCYTKFIIFPHFSHPWKNRFVTLSFNINMTISEGISNSSQETHGSPATVIMIKFLIYKVFFLLYFWKETNRKTLGKKVELCETVAYEAHLVVKSLTVSQNFGFQPNYRPKKINWRKRRDSSKSTEKQGHELDHNRQEINH